MSTEINQARVKICGLTRAEDIRVAIACGADALGFVMWAGSARAIDVDRLATLSATVSPFVTRVGLFVDPSVADVEACLPYLDLLQFHGDEPADFCARFDKPWIKAIRMRDEIDLVAAAETYAGAGALLLDAFRPGVPGGTGETFDWQRIPDSLAKPVILAGGLTPDNVAAAILQVRPYAVDVSGGVESGKGIKDPSRVRAFCAQVQATIAALSDAPFTTKSSTAN
ncbi:phosphoribosylanthranilate isomerase [Salinicola acroporae]|uniref:N-(5'-phosphoribosyl)anthranilate isomerase n=1 Tax=Salinicola acroporae TaxID=1541440 RepID=A0ABT6I522_9GAMM|nr:phosphoribosylanthranilate isomerase [Salinicola acroporae]MDH4572783.1 phosphoribosylanthranilate isomerase [Salinicola acroporae]